MAGAVSDWSEQIRPLVDEAMADIQRQAAKLGATEVKYVGLASRKDEAGDMIVTVVYAAKVPQSCGCLVSRDAAGVMVINDRCPEHQMTS